MGMHAPGTNAPAPAPGSQTAPAARVAPVAPAAHAATITPEHAAALVRAGSAAIIDVREVDEYRREHVVGCTLCPSSVVPAGSVPAQVPGRDLLVLCRSGARAGRLVQALRAAGRTDAYAIDGGIVAWEKAGLPVVRDHTAPMSIMRQVMITVGVLNLAFVSLAVVVSPWWLLGSGALGAGLLVAGTTGFCGLAFVLAKMPWNAPAPAPAPPNACCTQPPATT